ncbi:sulfotransferase [Thiorhodococcus fuscus]|uniref:Sulfotransferase n=1 Tax=Thiorhodococcus fuscus TaxID=527200 RepID=A0ABW4Y8W2_9GAMM
MMLQSFLVSTARFIRLVFRTFIPKAGDPRPSTRRLMVMAGFIPLFALAQGIHWLGFLLDEILFPGYRKIPVREPLFVLGVPRSGTTHLHRVLAEDARYTTFSTWECLFALSITARRFWLGVGWLDARVGGFGKRLLDWLEKHLFGGLEDVHSMRLSDPEEDYFVFMPMLACFILILPFPNSDLLWRMGTFDRDMPTRERERLLDFYRSCLKRHLYVHGTERTFLSKNAAFAPLAGALAEHFEDARFIVCLREPERTLPSQLSSIASGATLFGTHSVAPWLNDRLTEQLGFYYRNLERVFSPMPESRCVWVNMQSLKGTLPSTIERIYACMGFEMTTAYRTSLQRQATQAKRYRSTHSYSLEAFGLSPARIAEELGPLYASLAARAVSNRGDDMPNLDAQPHTDTRSLAEEPAPTC